MRLGAHVTVTGAIDLMPHARIEPGETGRIVRIDSDGEIWIKLETHYPGLSDWDNCIWLNRDTEEVLRSIRVVELLRLA